MQRPPNHLFHPHLTEVSTEQDQSALVKDNKWTRLFAMGFVSCAVIISTFLIVDSLNSTSKVLDSDNAIKQASSNFTLDNPDHLNSLTNVFLQTIQDDDDLLDEFSEIAWNELGEDEINELISLDESEESKSIYIFKKLKKYLKKAKICVSSKKQIKKHPEIQKCSKLIRRIIKSLVKKESEPGSQKIIEFSSKVLNSVCNKCNLSSKDTGEFLNKI